MSVYKVRFGTPEQNVPTKFAPKPLCEVSEALPEGDCILGKATFSATSKGVIVKFPIDLTASVYGFGLQLKSFQQRGAKKYIRPNADPVSNSGDTHAPVPFFVTDRGYGIFVDTLRYASFYCGNLTREGQNIMTIEIPECSGVDLYYFTGKSILDIVSQYNMFSGGGCMPPLWGLGGFYRCDMSFDQDQIYKIAHRLRELDIPCDIIGLEPGWQSHSYSCSFTWSEKFDRADELIKKLTNEGFHINLWEHAFTHETSPIHDEIKEYSCDYLVWNGLVPDLTLEKAREIFNKPQKKLVSQGITGFKLDECDGSDFTGSWTFPNCAVFPSGIDGEQYHNLFGIMFSQTVLEALGNTRTLSEVRNMGALAASYPFVLYSDLYGHKDFITGVVNSGFSGILWSPEVRHAECAEDLIRRVQTVIFSPQALVNAFYLPEHPWEQHNCTAEIRQLFRTRMELLPYLYTAFYDYKTTGKPPVRALVCDYEDQPECHEISDQYLFGDSMIIAPMTYPQKEREVWLPAGEWYDYFTGEKFTGGKHIRKTDGIPAYVRSGTLLPIAKPVNFVKPDQQFEITLRAYGDCKNATCRLVLDDGITYTTDYKVLTLTEDTRELCNERYKLIGKQIID